VNKGDLIAQVSAETGVSKRIATEAVDALLNAIRRGVAKGERVSIPGFGTFEKRLRAPRTARNPQTGTSIKIPAMSVPAFRPGQDFKDACRGTKKKTRKR
jgi:DNA-binding protein HU-beta